MTVRNLRRKPIYVWVPPKYSANFKLTVKRTDGTIDDITQLISYLKVSDGVTESIGIFEFEVWDPQEVYTHNWVGNEIVRYYKDYATTATTLRFRGRIEKPGKRGNRLNCKGTREDGKLINVKVTKSYENVECSVIFKAIVDAYAPGFTYANVETTTTYITVNWTQKPFFDCLKELASACGYEFYADASLDWHFFATGTVLNTTDAVVHDYNLLEVSEFTPDLTLVRNRVSVYGAKVDGIQEVYTAEQTTGAYAVDSSFGVREDIINDESVTSRDQAVDVANAELSIKNTPPDVGKARVILLATLQPGDRMWITSPRHKLPPGEYNTRKYEDNLDINGGLLTTTVYINKEPRTISHIMRDRIETENKKKDASLNPYEMRESLNFLYDTDSGSHSGTQVVDGVLKLISGYSTGTWTSTNRTLTADLSQAYLIIVGNKVTGATVTVSGDGGTNYQSITSKELVTLSSAKGSNIRIKIVISDTETQVDSVSILYKTE